MYRGKSLKDGSWLYSDSLDELEGLADFDTVGLNTGVCIKSYDENGNIVLQYLYEHDVLTVGEHDVFVRKEPKCLVCWDRQVDGWILRDLDSGDEFDMDKFITEDGGAKYIWGEIIGNMHDLS